MMLSGHVVESKVLDPIRLSVDHWVSRACENWKSCPRFNLQDALYLPTPLNGTCCARSSARSRPVGALQRANQPDPGGIKPMFIEQQQLVGLARVEPRRGDVQVKLRAHCAALGRGCEVATEVVAVD